MTQANLDNYALNKGYGKTVKEMTEAEKVTLRYNYVMDAMSDAQGAAKKEQDSFNGQMRYFKEQMIEIATRIGDQMLPAMEDLLKKINNFVEKIANLDDKGFKNIAKALVAVAAVAPLLLGVGKILGVVQTALNGWAGALKAIKGTKFAAFLAKAFGTATTGPIVASILAVTGVILAIGIALKQVWNESESFRNSMKQIWANIKNSVKDSINNIVGTVKYLVSSNSDSINGLKSLWEGFKKVVEFVATVIGRTVEFIASAFRGLTAIVAGVFTKNEATTKTGLKIIETAFKNFINSVINAFRKTDWLALGRNIMEMLSNGVKSMVTTFYNIYVSLMDKVFTLIKKIDWLGLGKTILDFIIKGISALANTLWNTVQKMFNSALQIIKKIDWVSLGQTLMRLIINGISAISSMIWNTLRGIFTSAKNNSEKSIDWKGIGLTIINMIVNGITILFGAVARTLWGVMKEAYNSAKNIDWASIGRTIVSSIANRISAIGSSIWNSLRNSLNNAMSNARNIDWSNVGRSIVNSIVSGITGLADAIYNKIKSATNTAKSWASGLWDNITGGKRSIDMSFTSNLPQMQRMAMPTMGNYYNPVANVGGHTISISVDARGDNADMIARRVERAIVRRIQS